MYLHHLEATEGGTLKYLEYLTAMNTPDVYFLLFQRGKKTIGWRLPFKRNVKIVRCSSFLPWRILQCALYSAVFILKNRPRVVHAHSTVSGAICRILSLFRKFKLLYSPHCYSFTYPHPFGLKTILAFLEKTLSKVPSLGVHVSESEARINKEMNPKAEIKIIRSPANASIGRIDVETSWRSQWILVVGSSRLQKGYGILERVQCALDASGSGLKIRVLGGSPKSNGVLCEPWNMDVAPFYKDAFCLLNVSFSEGASLAMIDAIGCGLPVVSVNIPSNRELMKIGSLLTAERDPGQLAEKILSLRRSFRAYCEIHDRLIQIAADTHRLDDFQMEYKKLYRRFGFVVTDNGGSGPPLNGYCDSNNEQEDTDFPSLVPPAIREER